MLCETLSSKNGGEGVEAGGTEEVCDRDRGMGFSEQTVTDKKQDSIQMDMCLIEQEDKSVVGVAEG